MKAEIKIAGFGGQGIVVLSHLIADAAGLIEGYQVTRINAYGPQSRGGDSWADVIIDTEQEISYPMIHNPDYLILFSDQARASFLRSIKPGGKVLYDPYTVKKMPSTGDFSRYEIPAQQTALEKLGSLIYGNMIMFGAFTKLSGIYKIESGEKAVRIFVAEKVKAREDPIFEQRLLESNLRAYRLGLEIV